jgi:phosphoribosylanthranilate isomerase
LTGARTWVKFCGCTSPDEVSAAAEAGADAVGIIFAPSPRRVSWDAARAIAQHLPAGVEIVGVFVDPSRDDVDAARRLFDRLTIQLSGSEAPEFARGCGRRVIKKFAVDDTTVVDASAAWTSFPDALLLFETADAAAGGTGKTFAWERVEPVAREREVVVAGGLTPENVGRCVRSVRPYGVDVRSGIESGERKDPEKMRAFIAAVRHAEQA